SKSVKGLAPAPNGKTPTPLPISARMTTGPITTEDATLSAAQEKVGTTNTYVQAALIDANPTPRPNPVDTSETEYTGGKEAAAVATTGGSQEVIGSGGNNNLSATTTAGAIQGDAVIAEEGGKVIGQEGVAAGEAVAAEGKEIGKAGPSASTGDLKDEPVTPEECNLFVGDLARNLTEEKLEKAFAEYGRV
ncbi:unnamed protein product, partial [Choristocarpus tenellus]